MPSSIPGGTAASLAPSSALDRCRSSGVETGLTALPTCRARSTGLNRQARRPALITFSATRRASYTRPLSSLAQPSVSSRESPELSSAVVVVQMSLSASSAKGGRGIPASSPTEHSPPRSLGLSVKRTHKLSLIDPRPLRRGVAPSPVTLSGSRSPACTFALLTALPRGRTAPGPGEVMGLLEDTIPSAMLVNRVGRRPIVASFESVVIRFGHRASELAPHPAATRSMSKASVLKSLPRRVRRRPWGKEGYFQRVLSFSHQAQEASRTTPYMA